MEARELRIGNLVKHEEFGTIEIYGLNHEIIQFNIDESPYYDDIEKGFFEPIPITEEWLLKFGFDNKGEHGYCLNYGAWEVYINNGFFIIVHETGDPRRNGLEVKYIHELQNFFSLTGTELTKEG